MLTKHSLQAQKILNSVFSGVYKPLNLFLLCDSLPTQKKVRYLFQFLINIEMQFLFAELSF